MKKQIIKSIKKRGTCAFCANARPFTENHQGVNGSILYACIYQKYMFLGSQEACEEHFEPKQRDDERNIF